jgi:hypothetical protein
MMIRQEGLINIYYRRISSLSAVTVINNVCVMIASSRSRCVPADAAGLDFLN